jgi:hypothetical protein
MRRFWKAAGGEVSSGIAGGAPLPSRYVRGPGDGLSDSIPVKMDSGANGRLTDGEFVVSADVVSGLGNGSSEAGARALYAMMDRIRQRAHGTKKQIRQVEPDRVLPA